MQSKFMSDIKAFHEKFGLAPVNATHAMLLPNDLAKFRIGFIAEELTEYTKACKEGDLAEAADAIVDMLYVIFGTAYLHNLPIEALWDEVHRVNMTKVRATDPTASKRGSAYDVVKPVGWTPPDINGVLHAHNHGTLE